MKFTHICLLSVKRTERVNIDFKNNNVVYPTVNAIKQVIRVRVL